MELSMTPAILKDEALLRKVKSNGFSDKFIANVIGKTEEDVYLARKALDIDFEYNEVDTCAGEFKL